MPGPATLAQLARERPRLMGILNVTPDSFSDGGAYTMVDDALRRALVMVAEGADVIDIGGESTRPGAQPVTAEEQCRRVLPVIEAVRAKAPQVLVSIDTRSSVVAAAALDAGAQVINDVSAGRGDPGMFALAARRGASLVLMHMQGEPATMQDDPRYHDVVGEVCAFLQRRAAAAQAAGVAPSHLVLDPGIGFGKRREHNLALMAALERIAGLGFPVLLGVSRKAFLGGLLPTRTPAELVPATCAATAVGVLAGVRIFRVHDVAANRQALEVAWQVLRHGRGP